MREPRHTTLDRLFARHPAGALRAPVPGAWSPEWRPRGRWWMRLRTRRAWAPANPLSVWRRLLRMPRAS
jgi:hypothetical protein